MTTSTLSALLLQKPLERPIYRALFTRFQQLIVSGELSSGTRLPSTRELADTLSISRNTAKQVYEMLQAEGYIETRPGAGSYIAIQMRLKGQSITGIKQQARSSIQLSDKSLRLKGLRPLYRQQKHQLLLPALPALDHFPWSQWQRSVNQAAKQLKNIRTEGYMGDQTLREQIAFYLKNSRGLNCDASQIMICSGSQQGLQLTFAMLLNAGDRVMVEDPGFPGIDGAIGLAGGVKVSVPIDRSGFQTELALTGTESARLAFITPSRNYPMGHTLTLERRMQLLRWAEQPGNCILEDDYDSEFRFDGPPLTAMQGLSDSQSVIYSGTFSRILHPQIRLAYLVLPSELVEPFEQMRGYMDGGLSVLPQKALACFMAEGYFASHLRRMRKLYKKRRDYLHQRINSRFGNALRRVESDGGMHSVYLLPEGLNDSDIVHQTYRSGLGIRPLSHYYDKQPPLQGLVIGFAGYSEQQIDRGTDILHRIFSSLSG